jgi:hypothetical protein
MAHLKVDNFLLFRGLYYKTFYGRNFMDFRN